MVSIPVSYSGVSLGSKTGFHDTLGEIRNADSFDRINLTRKDNLELGVIGRMLINVTEDRE